MTTSQHEHTIRAYLEAQPNLDCSEMDWSAFFAQLFDKDAFIPCPLSFGAKCREFTPKTSTDHYCSSCSHLNLHYGMCEMNTRRLNDYLEFILDFVKIGYNSEVTNP